INHFINYPNPFGIIGIDKDHFKQANEFLEAINLFRSIASGEDVVRLKLLILQEVKKMIEERIVNCHEDIFAQKITFE
ncbi:MAG: hypothetical protein AABY22_07505, partial [Nanoarchaeota archaeon]